VGTFFVVILVIALNLAPSTAESVTIDSYVVEGVGLSGEATRFLVARQGDAWLLHDAQGAPWYLVSVDGPWLTLSSPAGEQLHRVDVGAALGLPAADWWAGDMVAPPDTDPLVLRHHDDGVDVTLQDYLAAAVRW